MLTDATPVFYTTTVRYRSLYSLKWVPLWLGTAGWCLWSVLTEYREHAMPNFWSGIKAVTAVAFFLMSAAYILMYATGRVLRASISERGITIGGDFYPWEKVTRVRMTPVDAGLAIVFVTDRQRPIPMDRPLTPAEGSGLMSRLSRYLSDAHGHVAIEDASSGPDGSPAAAAS